MDKLAGGVVVLGSFVVMGGWLLGIAGFVLITLARSGTAEHGMSALTRWAAMQVLTVWGCTSLVSGVERDTVPVGDAAAIFCKEWF